MKKLFAILALCLTIGTAANAQWYLGGSVGIGTADRNFAFTLSPMAGYEFNDMMAVQAGLGVITTNYFGTHGTAQAWFRFTPWNNGTVYIDLLAGGDLIFDDYADIACIGIRPQLRFRVHPQVDFSATVGLLGTVYNPSYGWAFACGVAGLSSHTTLFMDDISLNVVYRF